MEEVIELKTYIRQVVDEIEAIVNQTVGRLARLYLEYDQEIRSSHRHQYTLKPLAKESVTAIVVQITDRLIELRDLFFDVSSKAEDAKKLDFDLANIAQDFTRNLGTNSPRGYVGVMRTDGIYVDYSDIMSHKIKSVLSNMRGRLSIMMLKLIKASRLDKMICLHIKGDLNSVHYLALSEFIENNHDIVEVILDNNKADLSDQYFQNFIDKAMTSESLLHMMLGDDDNTLLLGGIAHESIGIPLMSSENKHRLCISINFDDGIFAFLREKDDIYSSYVSNNTILGVGQGISSTESKALNPVFEFRIEQDMEESQQDDENVDLEHISSNEDSSSIISPQVDVVDLKDDLEGRYQTGAVFLCAHKLFNQGNFSFNEIYDGWYALDYALMYTNYWCVSYFLFKGASYNVELGTDTSLHIAAQYSSGEIIEILLSIPNIRGIINQKNTEGFTPLEIAIRFQKPKSVEALLSHGANTRIFKKEDLYSLAFEINEIEIVTEIVKLLLHYNVEIPNKIEKRFTDILSLPEHPLKSTLQVRADFFNAIRDGNLEFVRDFDSKYANLNLWRDFNNNSAVYISCQSLQYNIYAYLIYKGFSHDATEKLYYGGEENERKFKAASLAQFLNANNVLEAYLVSKTIPRAIPNHGDLRAIYNELISEPLLKPIFEAAEYAIPKLIVYMDFGSENVQLLSPVSSETSMGICDFLVSRIILCAKKERKELLGTTAHEFTHLACQIIWKNKCLPYLDSSNMHKVAYNGIYERIRQRNETGEDFDVVIKRVFTVYTSVEDQKAELIVRIPHIIARDGQEKGTKLLQQQVPELLGFYQDVLLVECSNFIRTNAQSAEHRSDAHISIQRELDRRVPKSSFLSNVSFVDVLSYSGKLALGVCAAYGLYSFFNSRFGNDTEGNISDFSSNMFIKPK